MGARAAPLAICMPKARVGVDRASCRPPGGYCRDRQAAWPRRLGIWAYDPEGAELSSILAFETPPGAAPEVGVTTNGWLYYAVPQNERDIWIARLSAARALTRIGRWRVEGSGRIEPGLVGKDRLFLVASWWLQPGLWWHGRELGARPTPIRGGCGRGGCDQGYSVAVFPVLAW